MRINLQSKLVWKSISILLLGAVFTTFNQCVVQQFDVETTEVETTPEKINDYHEIPVFDSGAVQFEETGATEVARTITSVGVKNFEEIYQTMSVLTGIDPADEGSIRNTYSDLSSQLPTDDSVKSYLTANQVAVIKLGAEFCERLFSASKYYNDFFPRFNIGMGPRDLLNGNNKQVMAQDFIAKFWGENTQPDALVMTTESEMSALITELAAGMENSTNASNTRTIAKGVCTAMISSAPVVLL